MKRSGVTLSITIGRIVVWQTGHYRIPTKRSKPQRVKLILTPADFWKVRIFKTTAFFFTIWWWNGDEFWSIWTLFLTFFRYVQFLSLRAFHITIIIYLACCICTTVMLTIPTTFKGIFATFTCIIIKYTLITTDQTCKELKSFSNLVGF